MGELYILATPIGNLEDVTLRALRILKEVDLILCEDTRVTKKLLGRYGIMTPTLSYHSHSGLTKVEKVFALLEEGKNLALVSDAGTPGISDPGSLLILKIKERFKDDAVIVPIPGPNAAVAALSASGFPASDFLFLGFLPHKKGREKLFKEIARSERTVVFYESPHRILKTLASLQKYIPTCRVGIWRELTKIYEEFLEGSPEELLRHFTKNSEKIRGEFTVMVRAV